LTVNSTLCEICLGTHTIWQFMSKQSVRYRHASSILYSSSRLTIRGPFPLADTACAHRRVSFSFFTFHSTGKRPIWCWASSMNCQKNFRGYIKNFSTVTISSFLGNWNDSWYDRTIQWYRALTMRYLRRKLHRIRDPSNRSYLDRIEFRALRVATIYLSK